MDVHSKEDERTIVDRPAPFFFSSAFLAAFSSLSFFLAADFTLRLLRRRLLLFLLVVEGLHRGDVLGN
jgi:hypothetical protein